MEKTVFIIICILILVGMLGLDYFISHDLEKSRKTKSSDIENKNNADK